MTGRHTLVLASSQGYTRVERLRLHFLGSAAALSVAAVTTFPSPGHPFDGISSLHNISIALNPFPRAVLCKLQYSKSL